METIYKQVAEFLVVDSGGFIKNVPLLEYGQQVITVRDVVDEIRDKATKLRLKALPYEIHFREPNPDALKKVIDFSHKTGDYGSLSLTDLKVLALVYTLEAEHVGTDHINSEPTAQRTISFVQPSATLADRELAKIAGFVNARDISSDDENGDKEEEGDRSEEGSDEEEEQDDDDEGWITPQNVTQKRLAMYGNVPDNGEPVKVACLTTDFAMQNVLKQMGLNVVSTDGYLIQVVKMWIKRCYACFSTTPDTSKEFCPKCGNKTLKRVSVTLNADGSQQIQLSGKKILSKKGLRYSLPTPKGGKHAVNPILSADQPLPQQRLSLMARKKTEALDPDYIAGGSPFALKDVTSKSAMLSVGRGHCHHWMQKNPNAASKNTGNQRRKR